MTTRCASTKTWSLLTAALFLPATVIAQESADGKLFTQKPEIAPAANQSVEKSEKPKSNAFADGPAPSWIWGADQDKKYFVKTTFKGAAQFAFLKASCDNAMTVWVNGEKVAMSDNWEVPAEADIKSRLKPGENVIEAEIINADGIAGFCAKIVLLGRDGKDRFIVTDDSWQVAEARDAKQWTKAKIVAKLAGHPGGKSFIEGAASDGTGRDLFNLPPGFQVEKLFTVPKDKLGSWVNITTDPKGRLIVSDQGNLGFCRVTPPAIGSSDETKVEHLDIKIDGKQMSGAGFAVRIRQLVRRLQRRAGERTVSVQGYGRRRSVRQGRVAEGDPRRRRARAACDSALARRQITLHRGGQSHTHAV